MPRANPEPLSSNYVESDRAGEYLSKWLQKYAAGKKGFELTCSVAMKNGQRVVGTYTWNVDETIDKVAEEIIEDCEEDCLRFRGKVRYSVMLLCKTGPLRRCNFVLCTPTNMDAEPDFDFDDFAAAFDPADLVEDLGPSNLRSSRAPASQIAGLMSELRTEVKTLRRLCGELMKRIGN